jgi:hypothetical protein
MVKKFICGRQAYFKVKSIKSIRRENAARARRSTDAEVTSAEVSSGDITFESVKEALVHIGLLDRFKILNPNNSKAPGTALSRLEDMASHFGVRPPMTGKELITFFVNLAPADIENYTKHLAVTLDRSASTVYGYLIGNHILFLYLRFSYIHYTIYVYHA